MPVERRRPSFWSPRARRSPAGHMSVLETRAKYVSSWGEAADGADAAQRSAERRPKQRQAAAPPIATLRERGSRAVPRRILGAVARGGNRKTLLPPGCRTRRRVQGQAGWVRSAALRRRRRAVPCKSLAGPRRSAHRPTLAARRRLTGRRGKRRRWRRGATGGSGMLMIKRRFAAASVGAVLGISALAPAIAVAGDYCPPPPPPPEKAKCNAGNGNGSEASPSSQASTATAAIRATHTTPATAAVTRSPRPGACRTRAATTYRSERRGGPATPGPPGSYVPAKP
jgi:hypothetical protein